MRSWSGDGKEESLFGLSPIGLECGGEKMRFFEIKITEKSPVLGPIVFTAPELSFRAVKGKIRQVSCLP